MQLLVQSGQLWQVQTAIDLWQEQLVGVSCSGQATPLLQVAGGQWLQCGLEPVGGEV